ncbi:MAG: ABC transporter permease [Micavibrio sp.]|nr:ABC transporter permease [Micavibrio sp.]|tara:strand:- start:75 stop:1805 length:1731 start_codon:yes stop_codon:yes gene_type:complete
MVMVKRLVREYLAPYAGQLVLAIFFMLIAASMTAAFATIIEPVMDKVLVAGDKAAVWGLGFGIFIIFVVRGGAGYLETILMNKIGQSIVANIQNQMFGKFLDLDLKFFHQNPSGQLISRVVNDVNALRTAVTSCLTGIGKSLITLVLLVGVMFYQDWVLALATLTIFPLAAVFVAKIGKKLRRMSGDIQEGQASLSDRLSQIFQGIRLVKAYGMEDHERQMAGKSIEGVKRLLIKAVRTASLSGPFNETLVGFVVFGIIVYGGFQVAAGETTAGELLSFITAFSMSYEPMKKLARLNNTLQMGLGATERVFDMLDQNPEVANSDNAQDIEVTQPKIELKNVSFAYESDDKKKALNNVSIEIPAGKVTALVGRSGSGKTTIMNLIPRFFDANSGEVVIGDHNIKDFTLASLRKNIALVSQDITIFDDTVWANIGYGREGAYKDEIIKAAIDAEADAFIRELPHSYDTRLGEDGVKLSGGQRQRISIARAMLRDAPILLLDEATSALDNESERAIQETLSVLQKGRTTLVIAHRLSTVQQADQIIVMNEGQVAEQGSHEKLIANDDIYARMHSAGLSD